MKTATYFRAYLALRFYAKNARRLRQRDKLAERITADLAVAPAIEHCARVARASIPANCAGCIYDHADLVADAILEVGE